MSTNFPLVYLFHRFYLDDIIIEIDLLQEQHGWTTSESCFLCCIILFINFIPDFKVDETSNDLSSVSLKSCWFCFGTCFWLSSLDMTKSKIKSHDFGQYLVLKEDWLITVKIRCTLYIKHWLLPFGMCVVKMTQLLNLFCICTQKLFQFFTAFDIFT